MSNTKRAVLFSLCIFPFMLNIGLIDFLIPLKYDIILNNLPLFGLLVSLAWFGSTFLDFAVGDLTDRIGVKRTIQIGVFFSFIGSLIFGFSKNIAIMTLGVFLWGLSYVILSVPSESYVLSAFPRNYRGSAFGWMFFFYDLAYAAAPLLGFLMIYFFDVHRAIIIASFVGLLTLPMFFVKLKSAGHEGITDAASNVFYKDGLVVKELKDIWKMDRKQLSLIFNIFAGGLWFMAVMIGSPLLFFHGERNILSGALLTFSFMLPFALMELIYGKLANSSRRREIMIKTGFILSAVFLLIFYFVQNFVILMALAFMIALSANMGWAASEVEVSNYLPKGKKGEFTGIFMAAKDIGFDLAPLFYGLFAVISLKVPFLVLGILLFLAGIVYMIANRKR